MSLQPHSPVSGTRLPRPAARRVHRVDRVDRVDRVEPPNSFIGRDAVFHDEAVRPVWIFAEDAALANLPIAPLAVAQPHAAPLPRKWMAAIVVSAVLHVAIAAWFLLGGFDDAVLLEGGQELAAVQLGDADLDAAMASASAQFEAVSVTIVPVAEPVEPETVEPEPVEPEPVEPSAAEAVQPVEIQAIEPELPVRLDGVPAALTAPAIPVQTPEILATDIPEIVDDVETVQPAAQQIAAETPEPQVVETPKPSVADNKREQARQAAAEKKKKAQAERQRAEQAQDRQRQAAAEKKKADDARARRAEQAAERREKQAKAAGQNGASDANARKGRTDGSDKAASGQTKGKGKSNAAGNAAVSNYPGKVRSRIARAAGKIPRSLRSKAQGDVVVSFTVTASGGLGGVSVARSSGLPALDSAAIAAVRRAAPFPAIPDGRSSWQFTIPMGLGR